MTDPVKAKLEALVDELKRSEQMRDLALAVENGDLLPFDLDDDIHRRNGTPLAPIATAEVELHKRYTNIVAAMMDDLSQEYQAVADNLAKAIRRGEPWAIREWNKLFIEPAQRKPAIQINTTNNDVNVVVAARSQEVRNRLAAAIQGQAIPGTEVFAPRLAAPQEDIIEGQVKEE